MLPPCEHLFFMLHTDMRQRFDNGEDPLDPEQQQGFQHGGPFAHPFGGQGFTFKFRWT